MKVEKAGRRPMKLWKGCNAKRRCMHVSCILSCNVNESVCIPETAGTLALLKQNSPSKFRSYHQ